MIIKKILAYMFLLLISTASFAYETNANDTNFKTFVSMGLAIGGDDLATFTDGTSLTTAGLLYFSFGTTYMVPETDFQIQAALGYNFDNVEAVSGSFGFSEMSFEIIPFYRMTEKTRIGFGLFNVLSAEFTTPFGDLDFDSTTGTVMEIDWKLNNRASWGVRYVDVELSVSSLTLDGSYVGFMYYGHF